MSVGEETTVKETVDQAAEIQEPEVQEVGTQESEAQPEGEEQESTGDVPSEEGEEPKAEAPPDWITDDVRALADSYGIEDGELTSFESGGDFHRACRLLDRSLTRGRQLAQQAEEETTGKETVGGEVPATPAAKEEAATTDEDDLTLDLAKYDEYDEDTIRVVKAAKRLQEENKAFREEFASMSQQVRQEFDRLHQERVEALNDMELDRFHDAMDKMDESLFGGEKALTEEIDGRRKAVWDAYRMIVESLPRGDSSGGRPAKPPSTAVLVRRAAMLAFGDEMLEAKGKSIYRSIHEQSRGRRPPPGKNKVIGGKASDERPKTIHEAAQEIANDPEIASRFDKYLEESGDAPH